MLTKKSKKQSKNSRLRTSVLMYEQQENKIPVNNVVALERRVQSLKTKYGLKKYAWIRHDQDQNKSGSLVEPHIHFVLIFGKRVALDSIAKEIGDNAQQFEVMTKRGNSARSGAENALMYLIHRTTNSSNKYQYDPQKVTANFDYLKFVKKMESQMGPKDLLDSLATGEINFNQAKEKLLGLGGMTYSRYIRKLTDVNQARLESDQKEWIEEMKQTQKSIIVVWIYGLSGSGKTRYALDFVRKNNFSYFRSGGSNDPLEGYAGEKVLILDELRPDFFKYADLLQFFDPYDYDKKTVARYHNNLLKAEYILITTPFSPFEFYKKIKGLDKKVDKFDQLQRRLNLILRFKQDSYEHIKYDPGMFQPDPIEVVVEKRNNTFSQSKKQKDLSLTDFENI